MSWKPIESAPVNEWVWVKDQMPPEYGPSEFPAIFETDQNAIQVHRGQRGRWRAHETVPTDPFDIDPEEWFTRGR